MITFKRGIETLRQPDRNPRCYEMTEQERLDRILEWNNRNASTESEPVESDNDTYYGA
jgi:hypothetical protein